MSVIVYGIGCNSKPADPVDAFKPKVGMTVEEVKATLGEQDWQYISIGSYDDPRPGERVTSRWELGYGEFRSPAGYKGPSVRYRLMLYFEAWTIEDENGQIVEQEPLKLRKWERDAP
jgi:hypothetical protein